MPISDWPHFHNALLRFHTRINLPPTYHGKLYGVFYFWGRRGPQEVRDWAKEELWNIRAWDFDRRTGGTFWLAWHTLDMLSTTDLAEMERLMGEYMDGEWAPM